MLSRSAGKKCALLLCILISAVLKVNAQASPDGKTAQPVNNFTYVMPDGSVLPKEKLDSLVKAWGANNIMLKHDADDDKKNIRRLVRMTDKMTKSLADESAKRKQEIKGLIGTAAPDFLLKDMGGKTWSLAALRGKVVVLNFWFTSCAPCIQEMPRLNKLTEQYKSKDVVFLGLTFNKAQEVQAFLKEHAYRYTLLPSSHETDLKYNVASWPASFVIDRNGKFKAIMGSMSDIDQEIAGAIDACL